MNRIPILVTLVSTLAPFAYCGNISPGVAPSIGIFLQFESEPSAVSFAEMKSEVAHLMDSTGLRVNWRFLKDNRGRESFSDLLVVRFRGKCRAEYLPVHADLYSPFGELVTLASTEVRDGRVLPFTEVECDQVRRTLGEDEVISEHQKQSEFGRALGRVVAHELYHLLAQTTKHTHHGLAKATHDWRDMGSGSLRFQEDESGAMRQGVLQHSMSFVPGK